MKKVIIFLSIFLLCGCSNDSKKDLETVLKEDNYIIVDVRSKEEYNQGHVKGSINIEYDKINKNTDLSKEKTILVYCKSGLRSSKAYNSLKSLGYDVIDLGSYDSISLAKEDYN